MGTLTKQEKEEAKAKDKKRADKLMKDLASAVKKEETLLANYENDIKPYREDFDKKTKKLTDDFEAKLLKSAEEILIIKTELIDIGSKNKDNDLFDIKGNWKFEDADGHYLHITNKATAVCSPDFSLAKFTRSYGEYMNISFKMKELLTLFMDAKERKKVVKLGVEIDQEQTVEIKQSKAKA